MIEYNIPCLTPYILRTGLSIISILYKFEFFLRSNLRYGLYYIFLSLTQMSGYLFLNIYASKDLG